MASEVTLQIDALRDLAIFLEFKKSEKDPWRNHTVGKITG